jgi:hypothetical protein
MNVKEIKVIAKSMDINGSKMTKSDLIRAIQSKEGNKPCFQTGVITCDQSECSWFGDCQKA